MLLPGGPGGGTATGHIGAAQADASGVLVVDVSGGGAAVERIRSGRTRSLHSIE
ncbi:hypothetical protein [Kitasatospora acidiphila]|uniref:hypothetical protein n=1 Tax=Kitasatospora acidiphila TaxID=2567942 RepID=UPI0015F10C2D|nr:hypothetical protein [Kitasatospora acidiphila]